MTNILNQSFTNSTNLNSLNDISTRDLETVSIGESAGKNATGNNNIFIGNKVAFDAEEIYDSIFIGYKTGYDVIQCKGNVYIGSENATLSSGTTNYNTVTGTKSFITINNSDYNTIFGYNNANSNINCSFNSFFGNELGNNLKRCYNNISIGKNNFNNIENGLKNIIIGNNNNIELLNSNNNIISIGYDNKNKNKSIILGNNIDNKSKSSISLGNDININNYNIFFNKLNNFNLLNENKSKSRLNLKNLNINPENNNNLLYNSLNNLKKPDKYSKNNNVDDEVIKVINIEKQISTKFTNLTTVYKNKYINKINEIEDNIVYQISDPYILIDNIEFQNIIDINKLNISFDIDNYKDYRIFIKTQPKYGYVNKLIYNKNESIIINEYPEYSNISEDIIELTTIIDIKDEISIFSRFSKNIKLNRISYKKEGIINIEKVYINNENILLYLNLIDLNRYFNINNKNGLDIYEIDDLNDLPLLNSYEWLILNRNKKIIRIKSIIYNSLFIKSNYQTNLIINNKEIIIKPILNEWIDNNFNNKIFKIFLLKNTYKFENFYENNNYKIYIEKPPKYGYINKNIFDNLNNFKEKFKYILFNENDTYTDEIKIRFIDEHENKITKSYKIIIYNFIINLEYIYFNNNNFDYSITKSLENNGFKWNKINNEIININNNYEFINIINDINRYEFNVINSNIYNNIELISNEITIDLYPFNNFNLNDKLKPLIKYENYYNNIIYLLSELNNGYILDNLYYNIFNESHNFEILLAKNKFNYFYKNVIKININIINVFRIIYNTQYIYENIYKIKTLDIYSYNNNKKVNNSNIFLYDGLSICNLEYDSFNYNCNIIEYKILFDKDNYDLVFDKINFKVKKDKYYFQIDNIPEFISDTNVIDYKLNEEIDTYFNIEFDYIINNIIDSPYNKYKFSLELSSNLKIDFKYSEISVNDNNISINNCNINKIKIEKNNLYLNDNIIFNDKIINNINKINFIYILSSNIINVTNDNKYFLFNYTINIDINDLLIEYSVDEGKNIIIGGDAKCIGYNNICLGYNFNTFGQNSIVLGSDNAINNSINDKIGINDSIIIGNNSFLNGNPTNIITVGNNIFNNNNDISIDYYLLNPIIIGNDIEYNSNYKLNIDNCIFKTLDNNIIIGNNSNKVKINNLSYNDLIDKPNILETNYYIGIYIKKDILTNNLNFINYNIREINSNQIYINELSNIYVGDLIRMNNNDNFKIYKINENNFEISLINNNNNIEIINNYESFIKMNYKLLFENTENNLINNINDFTEINILETKIYSFNINVIFDLTYIKNLCYFYVKLKNNESENYIRSFSLLPIKLDNINYSQSLNTSFLIKLYNGDQITFESNYRLYEGYLDIIF